MRIPAPKRKTSNRERKPFEAACSNHKFSIQKQFSKSFGNNPKKTRSIPKGKGKKQQPKSRKIKQKKLFPQDKEDMHSIYSGESVVEMPIGEVPVKEDDALCLFCGEAFSTNVRGELWIQCLLFASWCHTLCTGCENDHYICDFCK